jgi:aryl-alcohol dehydrogenase-like predicted oxidoreductase
MQMRALGQTGLQIAPLVLGGNVFGWTADERQSFEILDAFADHGFNAIDTADVYTAWVPGNRGGESEAMIGKWLRARPALRDRIVIFTKVGSADDGTPQHGGLSRQWILRAVERSLLRLGVEQIDVYFSHWPDPSVEIEETLSAYETLIADGKIKCIGASNMDAGQISAARTVAQTAGLPAYQVIQPEYNLYTRDRYEGPLRDLCLAEGLGVVPYYGLAAGFLTGKYRSAADFGKSVRGSRMDRYMTDRGAAVLAALDAVAEAHDAAHAEVALAWLMTRPGVTAPIASASHPRQVEGFARAATLALTAADLAHLESAVTPTGQNRADLS